MLLFGGGGGGGWDEELSALARISPIMWNRNGKRVQPALFPRAEKIFILSPLSAMRMVRLGRPSLLG